MGYGFASWSSVFLHLLLVMSSHGSQFKKLVGEHWDDQNNLVKLNNDTKEKILMMHLEDNRENNGNIPMGSNVLRLHSMDQSDEDISNDANEGAVDRHAMDDRPSSRMDHKDLSLLVFFFLKDLKLGKKIPIYFPKRDPSSSPHFLPREEAESLPFSSQDLPFLLQFFSFSKGSPQAKAIEDTLKQCEMHPIKGETKFCATSLDSMLEFTRDIFGLDAPFQAVSTVHLTRSTVLYQNYTIVDVPQEISAPKMVACHTMPYPFAVFYCHYQESESKAFKVLLRGENGDRVEALAVCHMDTSHWSHSHVSFLVLGAEPGSSPVCHFFPDDNLVWIPSPALI